MVIFNILKNKSKYDPTEVFVGTRIELEHMKTLGVKNKKKQLYMAEKIAKDHLDEMNDYYKKLLKYVEPKHPLGKKFK